MLSIIILTKNEEKLLPACLNSVKKIAQEIVVVDNGSNDRTVEIAQAAGAKVVFSNEPSFAKRREYGAQNAQGDWLLYVDADERVTNELAEEIQTTLTQSTHQAYVINRKDYYFGRERPLFSPMHRLFLKQSLQGWHGELHETPVVEGTTGYLTNYFIHLTHIDIHSMLTNTLKWSHQEASLRFNNNHPPVVWWRLVRVFLTGFWNSFVTQKGYKCGTEGWIEAIYQGSSLFFTYAQLWEMQNENKIREAYQELDKPFS